MTIVCTWSGEGFEPIGRYKKTADADYVDGQRHVPEVENRRPRNHQRHDRGDAQAIGEGISMTTPAPSGKQDG